MEGGLFRRLRDEIQTLGSGRWLIEGAGAVVSVCWLYCAARLCYRTGG